MPFLLFILSIVLTVIALVGYFLGLGITSAYLAGAGLLCLGAAKGFQDGQKRRRNLHQ